MLVIGHRGARGLAPENTLAGIRAALEHKVDGIEFDVRVTKDDVPVLVHDDNILGTKIKQTDLKTLKQLQPDLATLDEAMRVIAKRSPVVIEVKPDVDVAMVVEVMKDRVRNGWQLSEIKLASFDQKVLQAAQQLLPELTLVVNQAWSGLLAIRRARKLGTPFITMNQRWLRAGFIAAAAKQGYKLSAYTLDDPDKAKRWAELGLHAVITDYPDRFN